MSSSAPPIVRAVADLRTRVASWRAAGHAIALVPTMGALHEGHLSLVRAAASEADRVIVSVFVNPAQFVEGEDFDAYPRDEAADAALLAGAGCDLLYAPASEAIYPPGFATKVTVDGISEPLEGLTRPTHFAGVATIVAKLLIQAAPDLAVFGEKDYQQLLVVRRMAADLDLPVRILAAPTVRAPDGLALSSRNAYLTEAQRAVASRLNHIMAELAARLADHQDVAGAEDKAAADLLAAGFDRVDYIEARDADTLRRLGPGPLASPARVLAAVWLGHTRLIDNMPV